jgi:hypothetical protein
MAKPPLPYDLAEAVRIARLKRATELEITTAHPRSHTRQRVERANAYEEIVQSHRRRTSES